MWFVRSSVLFARLLVFLSLPLSLRISVGKNKIPLVLIRQLYVALLAELAQAFATFLNSVLQRS